MKHVGGLFRRTEGLRIGRTQRHQSRLEPLPYRRVGVGFLQVHFRQRRDPLEIGQRRHVHDRQARQPRRCDLDHQHADGVVGVLRLLHRKADQIVTREIDILRRGRGQFAGQIARKDRAVHRLVAQLDAHFGAVAVDQVRRLPAANQRHVVTGHQKLRRQQGAVGGPEDQNVARHTPSFTDYTRDRYARLILPRPLPQTGCCYNHMGGLSFGAVLAGPAHPRLPAGAVQEFGARHGGYPSLRGCAGMPDLPLRGLR